MTMISWLDSVYSDSTKYFVSNPYPKRNEKVTISLRMKSNEEVKKVFLRYREFGIEQIRMMDEYKRGKFRCFSKEVEIREKRFHYQFYLVTDKKIYFYIQYRITDYIPDESRDFVIVADYEPAKWVKNAVFYQIFPERFCNGNPDISVKDGEYSYQGYEAYSVKEWDMPAKGYEETKGVDFYGGDLEGIIQKLDYLQRLGVNAIYLNPIFLSPSVHKYDSLDYFKVDPHFGGDEALERLSCELHKREMKLMLDISINHTSSEAVWFNKNGEFYATSEGTYNNPEAEEREFYFFDKDNHYDTWVGVETMPKLNYGSQRLRDIIYRRRDSVLKKWLLSPYNIDGWRFDVAECLARNQVIDVHGEVLEEIRKYLKEEKRDVFLLAEDWVDCSDDLQGDRWDSTMNYYGCARPVREFVGETDLFLARDKELGKNRSKMTAKQLASRIRQFYGKLPGAIQYQMFNLLDSHDVARLHNNPQISRQDYETAVMIMFTLPGTASVYYGDEIALMGDTAAVEFCRNPMDWCWEEKEESRRRFSFYQKMIALKRNAEALADGGFQILSDEGYVLSYARFTPKELIIVIASTDDENSEVLIPLENYGFENYSMNKDVFGKKVKTQVTEYGIRVQVPAHTSYLLHMKKDEDTEHV